MGISSCHSELCCCPAGAASLGWDGEDEDGGGDPTTCSWQLKGCKVHCWHRSTVTLQCGESITGFHRHRGVEDPPYRACAVLNEDELLLLRFLSAGCGPECFKGGCWCPPKLLPPHRGQRGKQCVA